MEKTRVLLFLLCGLLQMMQMHAQTVDTAKVKDHVTLGEVTVKADKPLVKVDGDKMTYTPLFLMENKIVNNAFDLLKEIPVITCLDNKTLNVVGAAQTTICISGKMSSLDMVHLEEYLKMLPADEVAKIEVIKNPSPKWHTNGAVVNVVLKKKTKKSLKGEVQGSWNNQHTNSYDFGGSLMASTSKCSIDIFYSLANARAKEHNSMDGIHTLLEKKYNISTATDEKTKSITHHLFTNIAYDLGKDKMMELSYSGVYTPHVNTYQETSNSLFGLAHSSDKTKSNLHDIMLTFSLSDKIDAGLEYMHYSTNGNQNLVSWPIDNDMRSWDYLREQKINKYKGYIDMTTPLSKNLSLTYGLSYGFVQNNNSQISDDNTDSNESTTCSKVNETSGIAYVGVKDNLFGGKLSIFANLSGELYKIGDYRKNAILPNVGFTYIPTNAHVFQFTCNSHRTYPSYWQRQNYTSYVDEYTLYEGNPMLKPARSLNCELNYILHSKYILQLSYYRVSDFFIQQSLQMQTRLALMYKMVNIDYTSNLNITAIVPINIKKWYSANAILSLYNERYKSPDWNGYSYDRNKWALMGMLNSNIMLSQNPKISLNTMMFYRTPTIQGIWDLSRNWTVNCGLRYSFCNDKALLELQCNDIFESLMPSVDVKFQSQNQHIIDKSYRCISLTFSYKINGYKKKEHKDIDNSRYGINL